MKNKGIIIFLILLVVVIVAVMVGDWFSKRPDNMEANKFEYSVDEFKNVPDDLIHYKETKNFKVGFEMPAGLTIENNKIYIVGDKKLKVIDFSGKLLSEIQFTEEPQTVEVAGEKIHVAFEKRIQVIDEKGDTKADWKLTDEDSYITAVAARGDFVFVADAGTRRIFKFSVNGEIVDEFEGKASEDVLHGFIIPSPYFDIDINEEGDLWAVNPGLHALENYTMDGNLREHWQASGAKTETFSGCCNPAHYTFLSDGSFVTSEKGLVRIKVYKPSGEFSGVVAAPNKFEDITEGQAPDVAVDNQGNIYALDFDRKVLRVFELK